MQALGVWQQGCVYNGNKIPILRGSWTYYADFKVKDMQGYVKSYQLVYKLPRKNIMYRRACMEMQGTASEQFGVPYLSSD